jgi:hypothetical protein
MAYQYRNITGTKTAVFSDYVAPQNPHGTPFSTGSVEIAQSFL